MQDFFGDSLFFGMAISVLGYELGRKIKTKWRLAIFNPLLIAVIFVMVVLKTLGISYDSYNNSAKYLSYLLTPATVCLAIPLYQQMALLRENKAAIAAGLGAGVLTSLSSVFLLSAFFG